MKQITEKVKELILKDMDNGIVPKTITSFDDLQSYVDANMYFIESGFKLNTKGWVESLNQHIDEIHKWLETRKPIKKNKMISNNYNPSKDILKVVEQLIDIQWESKGCDYDFYEEIINKLSAKLGNEKKG